MIWKRAFVATGLIAIALAGCSSQTTEQTRESLPLSETKDWESVAVAETSEKKTVDIINAQGEKIGVVVLREEENGVRLQIEASQLEPGKHGFHIHEKNFEGTDFDTAGAHFNPTKKQHGLKNPKGPHLGDMRNLKVKEDGTVLQTEFIEKATLKAGDPYSLIGRSIVIHADEDDQMSDPAGNSGERIAAGNIVE